MKRSLNAVENSCDDSVFEISPGQRDIVKFVGDGFNVVCDCSAGVGKTTTCLQIAKAYPKKENIIINLQSKIER
jgi:hypothetical protein